MPIPRPEPFQLSDYHQQLILLVPDTDIVALLTEQGCSGPDFVRSISSSQLDIVHEGFGWSVRQVLEHLLDAERVFGYRLLRFASGDRVPLPGWDENHYAACGYCEPVDENAMADEFAALRSANLSLFGRLSPAVIGNAGIADEKPFSVNSLLYVMAAHWTHHENILKKRLATSAE